MNTDDPSFQRYFQRWHDASGRKLQVYHQMAGSYTSEDWNVDGHWFLNRVTPLVPSLQSVPLTLGDFGAGNGRLLSLWSHLGLQASCFEWSDSLLPILEEQCVAHGFHAEKLNLIENTSRTVFDIVFASQVFLHLPPRYVYAAFKHFVQATNRYYCFVSYSNSESPYDDFFTGSDESPADDDQFSQIKTTYNYDFDRLIALVGGKIISKDQLFFSYKPVEKLPLDPPAENWAWLVQV